MYIDSQSLTRTWKIHDSLIRNLSLLDIFRMKTKFFDNKPEYYKWYHAFN